MRKQNFALIWSIILLFIFNVSIHAATTENLRDYSKQISILQNEIDIFKSGNEDSLVTKTMILANMQYLEVYICKKLKNAEKRLGRLKSRLDYSDQEEIDSISLQKISEKIARAEKNITSLKDVLMALEALKIRIAS